jgi:hypothetical protein
MKPVVTTDSALIFFFIPLRLRPLSSAVFIFPARANKGDQPSRTSCNLPVLTS